MSLKKLREGLGMTQQQFSKKLNITQGHLSKIESGKMQININILYELRTKFKVDLNRFVRGLLK